MTKSAEGLVSVVLGAQWGDEGKGKLVDLLSHTVVAGGQEYFFHLLPSGIVNPNVLAVIGNGVVVNLQALFQEIDEAVGKGLLDVASRLRISDRCHLEELRGVNSLGTTKKGIGPTYSSKVTRNGLRVCDLMGDWVQFTAKYRELVNYVKRRYPKLETSVEQSLEQLKTYRQKLSGMVCDSVTLINKLVESKQANILVEGAQSCMLDIDFGTYPHVTSSNCSVGGVCTGLGLSPSRVGPVYGVIKAYTTRVGSGTFPTELLDGIGEFIQKKGCEWGVTTKRKRRIGWLDTVVIRYAHIINDFNALALTKIDVLDDLEEVKIAKAYVDPETGCELDSFPSDSSVLNRVVVVYETLPGWKTSTHGCRVYEKLPTAAKVFVETVEKLLNIPIRWIGTGASRDSIIIRSV
uniref:Adenylosuccinate synthetase n=1 Tax=Schistosoma haematobium TaxID=6185 RepID=A0A095ARH4_SCHHA